MTSSRFKFLIALSTFLILFSAISLSAQEADDLLAITAPDCDYGGNVRALEAVDNRTVRLSLCNPDPALPSKVAHLALAIHPAAHLEATAATEELLTRPIGTGPYQLQSWEPGKEIILSRFDDYWGFPASEPQVIIRWNPSAVARRIALQSGEVDGIDNVAESDLEAIADDATLNLLARPAVTAAYLATSNYFPPFDDVRVRQAIAHAIDRNGLVQRFYPPGSVVAQGFVPPSIFGSTADEVQTLPYDPDRARELLEEAAQDLGFTLPIQTTLSHWDVGRAYLPLPAEIASDIQAQLAEVGIEAEIIMKDPGEFVESVLAGQEPLYLLGWSADYLDGANFLDFLFNPAARNLGNPYPEIVEALVSANHLSSQEERYALFLQVNTAIRDLAPIVPLAHGASAVAFNGQIENANTSPLDGNESFAIMDNPNRDSIIWMQNGEPISLYCNDEVDGESFRVCHQIHESLLDFAIGGGDIIPGLAESWESNEDATVWTFRLRENVLFHDGSTLHANDVITSWAAMWDTQHPLHIGNTGVFQFWNTFFQGFLNPTD